MKKVGLEDKYTAETGRVYVTGPQALARLPIMQIQRDRAAGLTTAGFVSGYRGSPLGVYDMALWQAEKFLKAHNIHFQPGVNEDLAATAVWGTQQVEVHGESDYEGVIGIWYGKGPGVDRSADAIKHASLSGTSPHGGVLALCGDDHGARSSTTAHQSEQVLIHFGMPVLNPASIQEYLDFGLFGFALSRYCGAWIGFKCITDTVDGSSSVSVDPERFRFVEPEDYQRPQSGLHLRLGNLGIWAEERQLERLEAAKAFVRANGIDKSFYAGGRKRLGIVSTGKAWLDVMEALAQLGIDEAGANRLGIAVYKVGMVWPLEPQRIAAFARECDTVLVVEEKGPVIEDQLAGLLYHEPADARPVLIGKKDAAGNKLVPAYGELNPTMIARIVARERLTFASDPALEAALARLDQEGGEQSAAPARGRELERVMSFCAGCPHNTSTRVPEGSLARPGIGCHGMVQLVPGRRTESNISHMGAEGATWMGESLFSKRRHIFQNLGDGTYFHSGLLAIRANVAAGTNITYKVLVNGAISMTGGQVIEGETFNGGITAPHVANQVFAEGVKRIALVTEDLERHDKSHYPVVTTFHHRDDLDAVQKEIREAPGVSVLIYEQACATERRRLRKRGRYPDTDKRLFINEDVCEGCGDCGVQSNCIALEPNETRFGRKRKINQSTCNKDYSCVKGMCPSFVTVKGGQLRAADSKEHVFDDSVFADLPEPQRGPAPAVTNILIAGIGGSGIVTLGAILGMAAHMEERACNILDITGAAQRNGAVTSHVRIGASSDSLQSAPRIPELSADLILGADMVVASGRDALATMSADRTAAVYNSYVAPTAAFAQNANLSFSTEGMETEIARRCRDGQAFAAPATDVATRLLGNAIGANMFLLGVAWQRGLLPLSLAAIEETIALNGTEVAMNTRAFRLGRLSVAKPEALAALMRAREVKAAVPKLDSLESIIADRRQWLTDYQNKAYADRYEALVRKVADVERKVVGTEGELAEAVARYYAKLLAYKDEYEVARLMTRPAFFEQLGQTFEGDYRLRFNLAPPLFSRRDPETGRYKKKEFGSWVLTLFKVMAPMKGLRGTPLDIFGYAAHRRHERQLIKDYERTVETLLGKLTIANLTTAVEIARLPEIVRGYDVVKDDGIEQMKTLREELLRELQNGAGDGAAAPASRRSQEAANV